jgi:hypothetical protein
MAFHTVDPASGLPCSSAGTITTTGIDRTKASEDLPLCLAFALIETTS